MIGVVVFLLAGLWGVPGAVLSTPMLAISKIICDRGRPLIAFSHFMEG
jgi:predicted PurR-regulated permease PerM